MDKRCDLNKIEDQISQIWLNNINNKLSHNQANKFAIVLPPPNITGSLHIGHALNSTLQDIVVRYNRMLDNDVLWQPGTDHAGIATQMLVEKNLSLQGLNKEDLGYDKFVQAVWKWKNNTNVTILDQLKKLGCSFNWSKIYFTMDDQYYESVLEAFINLYNHGLIYKDKHLVNWDFSLKTAISDLEVKFKEVSGELYYIKYRINNSDNYLVVATTRPETLFGDVALAINPDDIRYSQLIKQQVLIPLSNKLIPVIADKYVDMKYGTGVLKITPAHDFHDYEIGNKHGLPLINILDFDGKLNSNVPLKYQNLNCYDARKLIVEDLNKLNLISKVEKITHSVPYGDRSNTIIEPMLTDQWMLNAKFLAKKAIDVVENKEIEFIPENWTKVYLDWMHNIQPWCISRQLWWGHRIPIWHGPDGQIFAAKNKELAYQAAYNYYKHNNFALVQETDVLDTWFSSGLWPLITLGWPQDKQKISKYYPTDILFTGFDIIFFWVARMIMMGLHFQNQIPFKKVYIHGLIYDEKGQKMSKTKGNIIDPLDIMQKSGTDALRFALTISVTYNKELRLSENKIESARKFITKIWNLVRFAEMHECFSMQVKNFNPEKINLDINQWIISKLSCIIQSTNESLDQYRFNDLANNLYHFVWNDLCDWYVELSKFYFNVPGVKIEIQQTLKWVIKNTLILLHPIMPFITEYLWQEFFTEDKKYLATTRWPAFNYIYPTKNVDIAINLIAKIRSIKSKVNLQTNDIVNLIINNCNDASLVSWLDQYWPIVSKLAKLNKYEFANSSILGIKIIENDWLFTLSLDNITSLEKLKKDLSSKLQEKNNIEKKLNDCNFITKAPENLIKQQRTRYAELAELIENINNLIE